MIYLRSLVQFYASLWSAYVERNDIYSPPETDWTDGT